MQQRPVLEQIRGLMSKHNLTTADIDAHTGGKKRGPKPGSKHAGKTTGGATEKKAASPAKGKLPPKYQDPKTGATWSGHARPPQWIAGVKDRTRFLIDTSAASAAPAPASKAKPLGRY